MLAQIGRFTGVGAAATLLHVLTALVAQYQLGLSPQPSNLIGFCAAFSLSFMGHSHFTFRVKELHATHFSRFLLVSIAGLTLSASITQIVCGFLGAPFIAAMSVVGFSVPALTFLISKHWAFTAVEARDPYDFYGVAAVIGVGGLCFAAMQNQLLNHDTVWYLVATRKWLEGMRLYVDIVEVNPPLNFYYTRPAIWIADATGTSDMKAQTLLTTGLMTLSLIWVWRLLQASGLHGHQPKFAILAGSAFAVFVPFLGDFAQREHTLVIFLLPYLIGLALGAKQQPARLPELSRAVFAGFGLCLKPHFMLIPAAITLTQCCRDRSLRPIANPGNCTIFAMGVCYVGLVKLLHPEYLSEVVPMALKVYGAYGFDAGKVIINANPGLLGLFAGISVLMFKSGANRNLTPVLAATLGCIAIYAVQWTGYGYQAAPFVALISLICAWTLAVGTGDRPVRFLAIACLCVVALDGLRNGTYKSPATDALAPYLERSETGRRLSVFSSSLWPSFPLVVATNATWTSRYPALWPIPGALNKLQSEECRTVPQSCAEMREIMLHTRTNIVSDFIDGQADLLVIDMSPYYFDDPSFNYIEFLSGDPRFGPYFSQYNLTGSSSIFSVYQKNPD